MDESLSPDVCSELPCSLTIEESTLSDKIDHMVHTHAHSHTCTHTPTHTESSVYL